MSDLSRKEEFREWLSKRTTLGHRTISDTVSRARRISGLIDLSKAKSREDVQLMTLQSSEFQSCSMSVRSQLKRAAEFYVEFKRSKN